MKGTAKKLVDELIKKRANGNSFVESSTRLKLLIKGIDVAQITESTLDDTELLELIYEAASSFNISLTKVRA